MAKKYKYIAKFLTYITFLILTSCIVSEDPNSGYINPRYPASPYGYGGYSGGYVAPAPVPVPVQPSSRYYTNPYDFAQPNYNQYYDADRYYRAPNSYGTRSEADSR